MNEQIVLDHLPPETVARAAAMKTALEDKTNKSTHDGEYSRQLIYRWLQAHNFKGSTSDIAAGTNMSKFNASYHLKKLIETGKIHRVTSKGNRSPVYRDGRKYPTLAATPVPKEPKATPTGRGIAVEAIRQAAWSYLKGIEGDAETIGIAALQLRKFEEYLNG